MQREQYVKELAAALVAYGAVLFGSIELLTQVQVARPWRDLVALSPMLPAAAMAWVMLRDLRRMDELQRRIQLEALGFSFAGTALLTFSYGSSRAWAIRGCRCSRCGRCWPCCGSSAS